jgi:Tfp pilus assembly protein PilE
MPTINARTTTVHTKRGGAEAGFSTVELMIVVSITAVLTVIAILQMQAALRNARFDSAMHLVVEQIRQAREYAITNRRYIAISFPIVAGQSQIITTQMNTLTPGGGGVNPVLSTVVLPPPEGYLLMGTLPDTPDGFGNVAPIEFEGVAGGPVGGMLFQSDGELVDGGTFLPVNGTVFIAEPNQPVSARAVTVLGTTGRVRGWKSVGTGWLPF